MTTNSLAVLDSNIIVSAYQKQGGTENLFEQIAQEVRAHVPDVTTKKGRDAIGSLAQKVSRSKTLIESCGKDLVAEQKAQIKLVDADRIAIVKKLNDLRDEVLAPRTQWQEAEDARIQKHQDVIAHIEARVQEALGNGSAYIKGAIEELENMVIDASFEEFEQQVKLARFEALEKLRPALVEREKLEAEALEAERLRQEEAERQQREHEERIAREAVAKAQAEAEQKARAEAERVEREKAEALKREQLLLAQKEAAELREVELKRLAETQAKQAEIEKQKAIEAERVRIERETQERIEAEQKAEAQRVANKEHMRSVNQSIVSAMSGLGISEDQAKDLIRAIHKNEIPHVSVKY